MSNERKDNRGATGVTSIKKLVELLAEIGTLDLGITANGLPRKVECSVGCSGVDDEAVEVLRRHPGAQEDTGYHTNSSRELRAITAVSVARGCVVIKSQTSAVPMQAVKI